MRITMKLARVGVDLTQREVAERLGVSVQSYIKYEKDPDSMTLKNAKRFADLVGVDFDTIFLQDKSNEIRETA